MLKPIRIAVATLAATAAVGLPASGAGALDGGGATSGVTATVTAGAIGSRSITIAAPVAMTSALDSESLTGSLATTVAEVTRTGTNPWSVTATLSSLSGGSTPTVLANSNMSISNRAVIKTAGGGTAAATSSTEPLSAPVTLFTNTGQSTAAVYTGTYASTSDWTLSLPNGTPTGTYTGTITLTLVQ